MAFVTGNFPDYPYYLPKLLIPSVSGYQTQPETYIPRRVIALNAYINWKVNRQNRNYMKLDWTNPNLIRDMGKANKRSMEDYINQLAYSLKSTPSQLKEVSEPVFFLEVIKFFKTKKRQLFFE